MRRNVILLGSLAVALNATAGTGPRNNADDSSENSAAIGKADVAELEKRFLKVYDTSDQSLFQPEYHDVTLRHCAVDMENLPAEKQESRFLLVKQAMSLMQSFPYRVRLVEIGIDAESGKLTTTTYPIARSTKCGSAVDFNAVADSKCTVYLEKQGNNYVGGTPEGGCFSDYAGATFFTSDAVVGPNFISSWDRGWVKEGEQAWGAVAGPYIFKAIDHAKQNPQVPFMAQMLMGKSSNKEQVSQDSSFASIDYNMCPIYIEGFSKNSKKALYIDQKIEARGFSTNRMRAYTLETGEDLNINLRSLEFTEEGEKNLKELCNTQRPAQEVLPSSYFNWDSNCVMTFKANRTNEGEVYFTGSTPEGGCESTFRGSAYLTIEEEIRHGNIQVWERWFDKEGKQVAGSETGPYIYKREAMFTYNMPVPK